jgi:hypothetical protein
VEHTYFLERTVSEVQRPLPGPILRDSDVATVLPKPEGGLSMWCLRLVPRSGAQDFNFVLCYAESDNGLSNWRLPELGLKEIDGNKRNNVLIVPNDRDAKGRPLTGFFGTGMFCVLDAKLTPHPKAHARYTALYLTNPPSDGGLHLAYSEDGLRWLAYPENPVYRGWPDTANNFFYDRRLGRYVLYLRPSQNLHAGPPTSTAWWPAPKATTSFTGTVSASCWIPMRTMRRQREPSRTAAPVAATPAAAIGSSTD